MKSITISRIHLGRYRIEMINDDGEYHCVDGGSAYVMMFITEQIFKPEHRQYIADQRKSSDNLGQEALEKMLNDPANQDPRAQKLIKSRMKE